MTTQGIIMENWYSVLDENSKRTGKISYSGMKFIQDIKVDLQNALKAITVRLDEEDSCCAYDLAEWVSIASDESGNELEGEVPDSEPFAVVMPGHCEGYLVRVIAQDRHRLVQLFTIKFLIAEELVWHIARQVSHAFWNPSWSND